LLEDREMICSLEPGMEPVGAAGSLLEV